MRGRRIVYDLLAILVVGVVLLAMVRVFQPNSPGGGTARRGSGSGVVEPEPYRDYLDAVERIVYADSTDVTTGARLAAATHDLAEAIIGREPRMRGTHAHQELFVFAMSIGANEFPSEPPDADSIRAAWEAVRDGVFREAYWFR